MKHYSSFLSKIDVTRGRSVPSPLEKHKPVQVLSSLNPYNSSPDLKLLLDLIASKSGSGLAIRCLAKLEADFASNWAPTGVQVESEADNIVVYWKDAVVINYLTSNSGIKIHYGVELEETDSTTKTRIISHQEVRFMKQTWRANNPASVNLGGVDDFIYHETFEDCSGMASTFTVRIWSVVNGQLISFSEKKLIGSDGFNEAVHSRTSTLHSHHRSQDHFNSERRHSVTSNAISCVIDEEIDEFTDEVNEKVIINQERRNNFVPRSHYVEKSSKEKKSAKNSKSSSETNLNFNNNEQETFSRRTKNRKSLPVGHINLAFISEDDLKDPYLLI